jgi:hypothetical protein
VVVVYGLIVLFYLLWRRPRGIRPWTCGLAFVAFAVSVQAYARINNQEHWLTDVAGGIVFGWMLLATAVAGVFILNRDVTGRGELRGLGVAGTARFADSEVNHGRRARS